MESIDLFESGQVLRWHHQPQMNRRLQTNADHQWGVAAIVMGITNGMASRSLIIHALFHDVGERRTGDLSAHFKRKYPEVAKVHKLAEDRECAAIVGGLPEISDAEKDILKAADIIEALMTILIFANRPGDVEGWPEAIDKLQGIATRRTEVYNWCEDHLNPLMLNTIGALFKIYPF